MSHLVTVGRKKSFLTVKGKKKAQGVIVGWTIRKETRKEQYQMQNESMSNTFIYLGGRAGPPNRIVDVLYIFLTGR